MAKQIKTFDITAFEKYGFSQTNFTESTPMPSDQLGTYKRKYFFESSLNRDHNFKTEIFIVFDVVSRDRHFNSGELDEVRFVISSKNYPEAFETMEFIVNNEDDVLKIMDQYSGFMPFELEKEPSVITVQDLRKLGFEINQGSKYATLDMGTFDGEKIYFHLVASADSWMFEFPDGRRSTPDSVAELVQRIIEFGIEIGKDRRTLEFSDLLKTKHFHNNK